MRWRWGALLAAGCLWGSGCGGTAQSGDGSLAESHGGAAGASSAEPAPDGSAPDAGGAVDEDAAVTDGSVADAGGADASSPPATSGLDPTLRMPELSAAQVDTLCEWSVLAISGASAACDALLTDGQWAEDCLTESTDLCEPVAAVEQCIRDMATNGCQPEAAPSCAALTQC